MGGQELANIELSYFQKIRKSIYLMNMSDAKASKYTSLPDYLKNDNDVIEAVINQKPEIINSLPNARSAAILQENPQLFGEIYPSEKKLEIILLLPEDKRVEYVNSLPKHLGKTVITSLTSEKKAECLEEILARYPHDVSFIKEIVDALPLKAKEENIGQIISNVYDWNYLKKIVTQLSPETIEENFQQILGVIGTDVDGMKYLLKNIPKDSFDKYEQDIQEIMDNAYENGQIEERQDAKTEKIFCKEYRKLLGLEKIQVLIQYPRNVSKILSLSSKKLEIFARCISNHMEKTRTEEWTQVQETLLYNITSGEYDNFIESIDVVDGNNIEFISSILQKNGNIYNINSQEDMARYEEIKSQKGDEWIKSEDIEQKRLAVLEKLFGQDITFSKEIVHEYGEGIDKLPDSDIKYYVQSVRMILNTNNPRILEQLYNECDEVTFVNKEYVVKNLKKEYFKEYNKTLFKVEQAQLIGENIYDAGTNFNMLVRCDDKAEDYKEKYEGRSTFRRQYFSTSYIRNDMISVFGSSLPDVCFGYSNMKEDSLMLSGHGNLKSNAHSGLQTSSLSAKYYTPDDQINKTDHHNEMCFRTVQDGKTKMPDYIVVFKFAGQIYNMEQARKAQSQLNNLPIVIVDCNRCLDSEKVRVQSMIEEYKQHPSLELAKAIAWAITNNRKTYAKLCEWQCAQDARSSRSARTIYTALENNAEEAFGIDQEAYARMRENNFFADFDMFDIEQYVDLPQSYKAADNRDIQLEASEFEKAKRKIEKIVEHEER